jgi:serine/threonine protein kinase
VAQYNDVIQEYALASWSVLEHYRIEEILRYDPFSITYKAFNIELDQLVTIKEFLPQELVIRKSDNEILAKFPPDDDVFQKGLKYFMGEAKALGKLSHPNIVRVLRYFRANGTAYMVMSHEDGETLRKQLDRMGPDNTMPEGQIKLWLRDVLDGLEAIHENGIYHRDIRPDTIFLKKDGSAMLIDFGAARYALNSEFHNENAVSPSDYSPEDLCADEGKGGLWTDIYQLGTVVYECVIGQELPDIQVRVQSSTNDETDPILEPLKQAGYRGYSKNFLDTIVMAISSSVTDRQPAIEALEKLRLKNDKLVPGKEKKEDVLDEAVSASEPEETPAEEILLEMENTDEPQEVKGDKIGDEADISELFQAESEEKNSIETDEKVSISEPEETPDQEAAGATDEAPEAKKEEVGDKPDVPEHVQIDDKEKVRGKDKKGGLFKVGFIGILVIGLLAAGFFVLLRPGLKLVSEPSASAVFLDENHVGETPLSIRTWMGGKHIISVTRKGYHDFGQSIEMQFGKTKKIYIELTPDVHLKGLSGSLVVKSTPRGATVFVDEKEKGVTPLNLENVEKGLHIVKVTKNCFSVMEKNVDITASKKIDIDVKLESICGSLVVKTTPDGATVFVDEKEKGVTPLRLDNVRKGNLSVKLIKKGFETESKIITVKPSEKSNFSVKLRQPIVSSDGRFVDHRNGTVTDTKTGLMWTREDSYVHLGRYLNWEQSRSYVNKLSTGGYGDWRLPEVAELKEIYEIKKSNTDKDGDIIHIDPIFSSGGTFWNWSSEEQDKCCAKVFLFIDGSVIKNDRMFSYERGVRAVRP